MTPANVSEAPSPPPAPCTNPRRRHRPASRSISMARPRGVAPANAQPSPLGTSHAPIEARVVKAITLAEPYRKRRKESASTIVNLEPRSAMTPADVNQHKANFDCRYQSSLEAANRHRSSGNCTARADRSSAASMAA